MEVFTHKIRLKTLSDKINLYFVGDFHLGSNCCDVEAIQKMVKKILRDPNGYMIGMGDYTDSIIPQDKRFDVWTRDTRTFVADGEQWTFGDVDGQHVFLEKLLEPLAKKGKIIGLHVGNHGGKLYRMVTDNKIRAMCGRLKCRYMGYVAHWMLKLSCKGKAVKTLRFLTDHGFGGGWSTGSKVTKHERYLRSFVADGYVMGHVHMIDARPLVVLETDGVRSWEKVVWQGISGSFLRSYKLGVENYAERMVYPPLPIGCLVARVTKDGIKCMEGVLF